ncbi:MAG: S-methyl-5-thioribose-1-phosphate isomerase [Thermodesulfobacteriota bacterium]
MKSGKKPMRPIWMEKKSDAVKIIDQRKLPHTLVICELKTAEDVVTAIQEMQVRGAPLIGVTGAYGVYLAAKRSQKGNGSRFETDCRKIKDARPTAVNLAWSVNRMLSRLSKIDAKNRVEAAKIEADAIAEEEAEHCRKIGMHGLSLIQKISRKKKGEPVNVLTHCNAGWLACIEWGTATAPLYAAFDTGIDIHVWVDETRPLNQGARLTAWELGKYGVPHTVITDNAGGHLMQHGLVDMVIVGTDRTTITGDVANKIGTYLKALAAKDNQVPFYVALPSTTFDWTLRDGIREIPIEERNPDEVRYVQGRDNSRTRQVLISPQKSPAANFAFDVTPARLVTGFITERGICKATEKDIRRLFPEK